MRIGVACPKCLLMKSANRKSSASKNPANLSIDGELLRAAKKLDINLSQTLEERLAELVKTAQRRQWLEENRPGSGPPTCSTCKMTCSIRWRRAWWFR